MIYGVYSMRDIKTGFLSPNLDINDASAIRNFEHAVLRNDDSLFFSHPEDYSLYKVAEFDSELGSFLPLPGDRVELITAAQIISKAMSQYNKEVKVDG